MNNEEDRYVSKANIENVITGSNYRFSILSEGLIRIEYSQSGTFNDNKTLLVSNRYSNKIDYKKEETPSLLTIETKMFKLEYKKELPFITKGLLSNKNLLITNIFTKKKWYYNHLETKNLGGGTFSLDEGKYNFEKGLFSLDGFSTIEDSNNYLYKDNSIVKNDYIDIYLFIYGKDFNKTLSDFYTLTGSTSLLKRSILGVIWDKNTPYGNDDIYKLVKRFKKHNIPISTFILSDKLTINSDNNLTLDTSKLNYPKELIEYLKSNNINTGLRINTDNNSIDKINYHEQYYNKNIKPFIESEISTFINDGANNLDLQMFNRVFEEKSKESNNRGIVFNRNYANNVHTNSIIYSGNTISTWELFKKIPFYNIMTANSGISYISHAIGGYKDGIEDPQLYLRYIQFGVFSSILRLSSEDGEYYKRAPYEWDSSTYNIVKDYLQLRYKLIPYLYSESFNSIKEAKTLIEPLINSNSDLYFNDSYKNEYYLGKGLLISPITSKKDTLINCCPHHFYLPNGTWYSFKDGKKYNGNKKHLGFFKDEDYPVFCKAGAIIPMAYDNEYNNTYNPKNLEIIVFPGQNNSYQLYEDNGVNYDYLKWIVHLTNFEYECFDENFTLRIKIPYKYPGVVGSKRNYRLRFKNISTYSSISVKEDNKDVYYISYQEDNDLIIILNDIKFEDSLVIDVVGREIPGSKVMDTEIHNIINDLVIDTAVKIKISNIFSSNKDLKNKRIKLRKLEKHGLSKRLIEVLLKLVEIKEEI